MKRIEHARGKTNYDFTAGDYVYVYRLPRETKRKHDMPALERQPKKHTWIGPGTVITPDGASLWMSMFGELWRAAKDRCRPATNSEKMGIDEVMRGCRELIEEYKRSGNRKGYKDIREEAWPDNDEEKEGEDHGRKKPRETGSEDEDEHQTGRGRRNAVPRIEEEEHTIEGVEEYTPSIPKLKRNQKLRCPEKQLCKAGGLMQLPVKDQKAQQQEQRLSGPTQKTSGEQWMNP